MLRQLAVFLNREPLGTISFHGKDDRYDLEYASSWLAGRGYPISPHLTPGVCQSEKVGKFLANLLSEGKWLEELLIDTKISKILFLVSLRCSARRRPER